MNTLLLVSMEVNFMSIVTPKSKYTFSTQSIYLHSLVRIKIELISNENIPRDPAQCQVLFILDELYQKNGTRPDRSSHRYLKI